MLSPGRTQFKIGDLVWVDSFGQRMFKEPRRIRDLQERDGKLWALFDGEKTGAPVDGLTLATPDDPWAPGVNAADVPVAGDGKSPFDDGEADIAKDFAADDGIAKEFETAAPADGNAAQAVSPNAAAMRQHVEHLFGGYLDGFHDGLIELAWTDTKPDRNGKYLLRHAKMFGTDQIDELVTEAVRLNSQPMRNVYIGAALRKPGTPDKRASREDVLALTACYADLDEPDAAKTAKEKYARAKPTLVVVTGRHPHLRAQPWWRLTEPITDPRLAEALLKGMAHALDGDTSVTDPPRVMRLAGSVAWPMKPGRKLELTSVVPLQNPGQATYTYEHLAAEFPPPPTANAEGVTPPDDVTYSTNILGFDDKIADGRERYMLRTINACLIQFVGETGKAPTAQELFDLAWPQYERRVEFSKPGRGVEEFADKCAYTITRFHACKIRGCETIEKTAELYRQRQQARAGQEEQVRRAEAAPAAAHPADPVDLWGKFDPPPLPRGLLPKVIEDFAFDRSTIMGCDEAGLAVGALVACAASIPEDIKLQPKRHDTEWREAARLWVALVGSVSAMKSPMLDAVAKEVRRIDAEMARDYQEALAEWNNLPDEEQKETPRPKPLRARIMNTTVEASQEILRDNPNGVLLDQDELSGWFGSMDKYSGPKGAQADRAFWLQAYNGGPYTVDRVTRGTVHIPHLSVSILGFIQPEPIRKLADGGEDDGLLQRFIPIILRPAVAGRDAAPGQAVFDYADLIKSLRDLKPPQTNFLVPSDSVLKFDDGALKIREALEKKHLELTKLKSLNRKLTSHIGKYNGIFARLCVIWHCIEHVDKDALPGVVTEDTARRVASFLHGFLLPHALAFYSGVLGLANDHDRLTNVADYILAHKLEGITSREVQRGDRSMRGLKRYETEAIFEQLEALGWVMKIPGLRLSDPPRWVVNPVVHQKFAERAEAEKKRRGEEREMITDLLKGDKT